MDRSPTSEATLAKALLRLPTDRPVTRADARAAGVHDRLLRDLVEGGYLRHPLRGVYVASPVVDTLDVRAECLRLVVPPGCVVTDRTAGWIHGANMILAPGDHLRVPEVQMFCPPGYRLRNGLADSGERMLAPGDILEVGGLLVTSPLRTALDLGRLLRRDRAMAALDSMLGLDAFSRAEMLAQVARFKGFRGVRQLRGLAPLADGRSQSPGESVVRLRWYDSGCRPWPQPQVPVVSPLSGTTWWIDVGAEEVRFGMEYDGAEWHGPADEEHDAARRAELTELCDWILPVCRKHQLYGPAEVVTGMITQGMAQARARLGLKSPWTLSLR